MRTTKLFVAVAALTALAPALANQSATQTNQPAAQTPAETNTPCQAYQMAADGSWTQAPCQEAGAAAQPKRKSATRGRTDNVTR